VVIGGVLCSTGGLNRCLFGGKLNRFGVRPNAVFPFTGQLKVGSEFSLGGHAVNRLFCSTNL